MDLLCSWSCDVVSGSSIQAVHLLQPIFSSPQSSTRLTTRCQRKPPSHHRPPHLPLYLAKYQPTPSQRRHFGIFIPYPSHADHDPDDRPAPILGSQIHVIGNPMSGSVHEFKRAFNPFAKGERCEKLVLLGFIDGEFCSDGPEGVEGVVRDHVPRSRVERKAVRVEAPRGGRMCWRGWMRGKNRRCQEWTMDFLKRLVEKGWVDEGAVRVAEGRGMSRGLRWV
ncbi:hypothetical protein KVT40_000272 [Elsinoe batatas]|uniref:Uncharacterized protein n=1 Tax=Elsinoe batatas TaxID=2601811 RepID=A0A8K0L8H1_9PEZI|nr:hypothetical protein KVT40_000272 [Elsinoe batatas]